MQKSGPHLAYISVFSILLILRKLFFSFVFLECFLVISGLSMDMHIDTDALSFLNPFSECWLVGRLQLSFLPWVKPLVTCALPAKMSAFSSHTRHNAYKLQP